MQPVVYILHFKETDRYYVGSTSNLERRLKQHASGHTHSTKRLGKKFELAFYQEVSSLTVARSVERRIKLWKRKDYVKRIVDEGTITFLADKGL